MEDKGIESEFIRMIKCIDIYIQQKTNLFLQHYVFEPIEFYLGKILFLSFILILLGTGTVVLVTGVILFIATLMPLWSALLISGIAILGVGGIAVFFLCSKKILLKTPTAAEMVQNEIL